MQTVEKLRELWFWRWGAMDQTTNHEIRSTPASPTREEPEP